MIGSEFQSLVTPPEEFQALTVFALLAIASFIIHYPSGAESTREIRCNLPANSRAGHYAKDYDDSYVSDSIPTRRTFILPIGSFNEAEALSFSSLIIGDVLA